MTSLNCPVGPQVAYPESVETIPFQKFDATSSASLSGPPSSPPEGEVFRLALAGRLLMAADDEELGAVDEDVRADVRRQWPD